MHILSASRFLRFASLVWLGFFLVCCDGGGGSQERRPDEGGRLAGTWVLSARLVNGREAPATDRLLKLILNEGGTFRALYRGDTSQPWITAGDGCFTFKPPALTFHWGSGKVVSLLVVDFQPGKLRVHHGKTLAPLKDQEPDEVFSRQKADKAPGAGPS